MIRRVETGVVFSLDAFAQAKSRSSGEREMIFFFQLVFFSTTSTSKGTKNSLLFFHPHPRRSQKTQKLARALAFLCASRKCTARKTKTKQRKDKKKKLPLCRFFALKKNERFRRPGSSLGGLRLSRRLRCLSARYRSTDPHLSPAASSHPTQARASLEHKIWRSRE